MNAEDKNRELARRLYQATDICISMEDAQTLRRAEQTLHAWDKKRCGWSTNGRDGASFVLVRDEDGDNKPYLEIHPNDSLKTRWQLIPDLEGMALRRVSSVCKRNGLDFNRQGDPRGCSLHVFKAGDKFPLYGWGTPCHVAVKTLSIFA